MFKNQILNVNTPTSDRIVVCLDSERIDLLDLSMEAYIETLGELVEEYSNFPGTSHMESIANCRQKIEQLEHLRIWLKAPNHPTTAVMVHRDNIHTPEIEYPQLTTKTTELIAKAALRRIVSVCRSHGGKFTDASQSLARNLSDLKAAMLPIITFIRSND